PEPGMGGRTEEEMLVLDEMRKFRRVELQDVGACPPLDWHVEHLARYLVLDARQSCPIGLIANCLREQLGEDNGAEVVDLEGPGIAGLLARRDYLDIADGIDAYRKQHRELVVGWRTLAAAQRCHPPSFRQQARKERRDRGGRRCGRLGS